MNYTSQRDVTVDLSPRRIPRLLFKTAERLGLSLSILPGWSGFPEEALAQEFDPGWVACMDFRQHDWLLAQVECIIHLTF